MFIVIFFITVAMSQYIANKMLNIDNDNKDSYIFERKESLIIFIILLVGIILQLLSKISIFNKLFWPLSGIYLCSSLITMMLVMSKKKARIEQVRVEITQIYEILQKLVDKKNEGLNFNKVPFELSYKYGYVQQIKVAVEPTTFDDKILSMLLQQLNSFLPKFEWNYEPHLEERYILLVGSDKPPNLARWPGSWLRHFRYMPIGISGDGEVGWQPDVIPKNRMGESQYLDEYNKPIPTNTKLPRQPQGLNL